MALAPGPQSGLTGRLGALLIMNEGHPDVRCVFYRAPIDYSCLSRRFIGVRLDESAALGDRSRCCLQGLHSGMDGLRRLSLRDDEGRPVRHPRLLRKRLQSNRGPKGPRMTDGFRVKWPSGQVTTGAVCCGLIAKNCTVRLD